MSDKKPHKKPLKQAVVLTEEAKAAILLLRAKALADEKAERERIEFWAKSLPKLTQGQLVKELKRVVRKEYVGKEPQAGLTIGLGTILLTVLENTNTPENPFGKLHSYPR
jgi:hypothetical protein